MALNWASYTGNAEIVAMLLKRGADVEATDMYGSTALIKAIESGYTDIVTMLLKVGADVNVTDNDGWTALIWASWRGHKESVTMLLEKGANMEVTDYQGNTALMEASEYGHTEIEETLIRKGAIIPEGNKYQYLRDMKETILKEKTMAVEVMSRGLTKDGNQPILSQASKEIGKKVVSYLGGKRKTRKTRSKRMVGGRDSSAENSRNPSAESSPINVPHNVAPERPTDEALLHMYRAGMTSSPPNPGIVRYALSWGNIIDVEMHTNLYVPIYTEDGSVVYYPPVAFAAANGSGWEDIAFKLIRIGHDVNRSSTPLRETPLIIAAKRNFLPMVMQLLYHDADPTLSDSHNNTALTLATAHGNNEMVAALSNAMGRFHAIPLPNDE